MTDDQITALARVYAEEATKADASDPNLSATDLNGIKHDVAEYAEEVIRFLLRRYCLVEKSKVEEEYYEAKFACGNVDPCSDTDTWIMYHTEKSLLERLFPEIAKEVEG